MSEGEGEGTHTVASQLSGYLRAGGIITPLLTALIAFFIGGLVVARHGGEPAHHLQGDLRRLRPQLAVPVGHRRRPHARGAEPPADAHHHDPADPHGHGGRVRVPRRAVQHRRPGPVLRRALPRRHRGGLAGRAAGLAPHPAGAGSGDGGRRCVGRDRRVLEGDHRRQRGDLDDHAQLRRALDRRVGVRPRRAAALGRRVGQVGPDLGRGRRGRTAARVLGRPGAPGPAHRDLHRRPGR